MRRSEGVESKLTADHGSETRFGLVLQDSHVTSTTRLSSVSTASSSAPCSGDTSSGVESVSTITLSEIWRGEGKEEKRGGERVSLVRRVCSLVSIREAALTLRVGRKKRGWYVQQMCHRVR